VYETLGTLNLKIARLEQFLKVLDQQLAMSNPYPDYQVELKQHYTRIESHLGRLVQYRRRLTQSS
jgi:hypothetical protein